MIWGGGGGWDEAEGKIDTGGVGVDLLGLRQQTGCPKLRWSFTLRHRAEVRLQTPASPRITQRQQEEAQGAEPKRGPLCAIHSVLREDRLLRCLETAVCCRYQERKLLRFWLSRAALTEEPLAWMHHGHVCLQGSVFRWYRSFQQHQLSRADQTPPVLLQRGYPPHQPARRSPPAPQSSAQGRINRVVNKSCCTQS